jgi:hypothetical protein
MTVAVPKGEPETPRPKVVYTPKQIAERQAEAERRHEVVERSLAERLFSRTKWGP